MYDDALPSGHPNRALVRVNIGNIYFATCNFDMALTEYENALRLQESSLPADHPDIARTLHNLALAHLHQGDADKYRESIERAESTAVRMLKKQHPMLTLLSTTKNAMVEDIYGDIHLRL
jgi:tetratricopeptide (TPR) repeat protein